MALVTCLVAIKFTCDRVIAGVKENSRRLFYEWGEGSMGYGWLPQWHVIDGWWVFCDPSSNFVVVIDCSHENELSIAGTFDRDVATLLEGSPCEVTVERSSSELLLIKGQDVAARIPIEEGQASAFYELLWNSKYGHPRTYATMPELLEQQFGRRPIEALDEFDHGREP